MKHAWDVLNEIEWRKGYDLAKIVIYYHDRVESRLMELSGDRIESWDKSFIYTVLGSAIPFHRVQNIYYGDLEVYARRAKKKL